MDTGEALTRITAWLAFAAWFMALAVNPGRRATARAVLTTALWFAGSLIMLAHTALAFHFAHQWSHAAAVVDTARQTRELTGIDWGGGVWLNYLFAALWLADASWRTFGVESHTHRPRWLAITTHAFLAFIWFNATVVFGSWPMRVAGIGVFAILCRGQCYDHWSRRRKIRVQS